MSCSTSSSSHGHAVVADCVLPTQAMRSRHASSGIEASGHARIPSPPAQPPVLVLWLNQVTRRFSGEPPQTPRADSGCELLPCTGYDRRLRLAFLATMRPALDPAGHRVPRVRSSCLSTSRASQGIDHSRSLLTCTNANQATTCTCNTQPRFTPHHVVNHSSQPGVTIHRSLDAPVLNRETAAIDARDEILHRRS
jgi:hypothetical protein